MQAESEIKEILNRFVHDYFLKDPGLTIKDNTSLLDEGIIDSTGVLELVAFLEETFGFAIEDEELIPDNLDSINQLVHFIRSKTASLVTS